MGERNEPTAAEAKGMGKRIKRTAGNITQAESSEYQSAQHEI